ncbi:MAG: hypothetical protein LBT21_01900 [Oscillospiraceae bacterium]|jgi:hypothetical protein|nr:hypothetical protein [Oscillospiraceae bacterium]
MKKTFALLFAIVLTLLLPLSAPAFAADAGEPMLGLIKSPIEYINEAGRAFRRAPTINGNETPAEMAARVAGYTFNGVAYIPYTLEDGRESVAIKFSLYTGLYVCLMNDDVLQAFCSILAEEQNAYGGADAVRMNKTQIIEAARLNVIGYWFTCLLGGPDGLMGHYYENFRIVTLKTDANRLPVWVTVLAQLLF